jgi:hypothetical protein
MITVRMTTDVKDDRRVVLTLPPEVPIGKTQLVVTVESLRTNEPWGVPAAAIRGIATGQSPPPDDTTVDEWLEEQRAEKYE